MPPFAPARTVNAEKLRGQTARTEHHRMTVHIGGRAFECEVFLGAVKPETDANTGAVMLAQRGRASILKTLLELPPKRNAVLRLNESALEYIIADVGGHQPSDPAWLVSFYRLPPSA